MTILVILISTLALLGVVVLFVRGSREAPGEPDRYPFESRSPLTDSELALYRRLRKLLPDHIILAQVGLSRILRVQAGHDFRAWFGRIDRMTIDFLVCRSDATIVAAIELEDAPHGPAERAVADAMKTRALESAGIRLVRLHELPTEEDLRKAFLG